MNPLCGDRIRMELRADEEGQLRICSLKGEGCCVSQAAASMLVEHFEDVRAFGPEEMLSLFGFPLTITRKKCCLLPWRAIQTAIVCPALRAVTI
jgi:nitrogen fixation NifU-like protein